VLDAAHHIGCSMLTGVTYSALGYKTGVPPTEREYETVVRALKPVARKAADLGMTFGLEPCTRFDTHILNTADQTMRLIERIDEPNVFVHLDTYHMNVEEDGYDTGLRRAAGRMPYLHLSESHRGTPGTGTVDWELVFRTLADIGDPVDLVVEAFVEVPPQLATALCMWRPASRDRFGTLDVGLPYLRGLAARFGL
jgi:D-psicose/D-tagatose/L-ribulose 3-epimerase